MRQTLLISALLIIAVSSACTRQGSTSAGVVPDALTAMSEYRCDPIDRVDVSSDLSHCAAKTMAGQRAAR